MIKKYSLIALEKIINQTFSLDDTMAERLQKLDGKVLKIVINPMQIELFLSFANQKIHLTNHSDHTPDTIIHSKPLALLQMGFLPSNQIRSLFQDKIHLSGDAELGQEVKKLFEELDIDWETHLARLTGDAVAFKIGDIFRRGKAWQQQVTSSLHATISDYIHEEAQIFPPREEVNDFFHAIDDLALAVERLQAKINQLVTKQ